MGWLLGWSVWVAIFKKQNVRVPPAADFGRATFYFFFWERYAKDSLKTNKIKIIKNLTRPPAPDSNLEATRTRGSTLTPLTLYKGGKLRFDTNVIKT